MPKLSGGCLCGKVRFEVYGDAHFSAVCHCPSCRKSAGAPIVGWVMYDRAALTCDRSNLTVHESSPGVRRSFCRDCGTTLFFEADYIPGLIDITTESFDDPATVLPHTQIWAKHETDCVRGLEDMTKFQELPPQG